MIRRNIAPMENWIVEFRKLGEGHWKVTTRTTLSTGEWEFKLDEERDEETFDGRHCKVMNSHVVVNCLITSAISSLLHVRESTVSSFSVLMICSPPLLFVTLRQR
jgi:hypothetical protein